MKTILSKFDVLARPFLHSAVGWQLMTALFAGILMGLTPAPVYAWFLAWIALVPLWILVVRAAELPPKPKIFLFKFEFLLGLMWGIGYHGCALFWITGIHPMTWMGVPWLASLAIALFCWVFITLWGAVLVAMWAWLFCKLCRSQRSKRRDAHIRDLHIQEVRDAREPRSAALLAAHDHSHHSSTSSEIHRLSTPFIPSWLRILMGTALWCGLETLWGYGRLNWTYLAYTQSPLNLPILHLGQISGLFMVTAAIVSVNGLLAEAWIQFRWRHEERKSRQFLALSAVWLIGLHSVGGLLYSRPIATPAEAALNVGIVQGNIPNTIKLYEEGWRRAIEGYTAGYRQLADQGADVVLTPETALPTVWMGRSRQESSFYQAILEKGVPAWLGAFGKDGNRFTNSLFTIAGNGETLNEYRKVLLVPLGEYIPFENVLGRFINRLSPLDAQLRPGKLNQLVDTPFGRAIAAICYESAFPRHFRYQAAAGGQFIITASNDAHYSPTMPAQHHAQDVMRAIETDRWAARATNTGYSAIVDPHGNTLWISGINTYEQHLHTIYRRQTQTLYVRWGDWFTPLLVILATGGWIVHRMQQHPSIHTNPIQKN